jgi:ribosomal protein L11 methyltransferase
MSDRANDSAHWGALVLEVPSDLDDEVAGRLALGDLGAELHPEGERTTRIRVFLRSPGRAAEARRSAATTLRGLGLDPERCGLRTVEIEEGHWVERFQATLRPIALGRRFLVEPSDIRGDAGDRLRIRLAPGRAFGTGEHATTQLCVEQLESRVQPASRWLDLGCGTALLALATRHCGAGEVLAVDIDESAVEVAEEVLAANGMGGQVEVRQGSIELAAGRGPWDGIVANIHASFFLERAAELGSALDAGGLLIASGFLIDDLDEIGTALAAAGVAEEFRDTRAPWAVWVGRKTTES